MSYKEYVWYILELVGSKWGYIPPRSMADRYADIVLGDRSLDKIVAVFLPKRQMAMLRRGVRRRTEMLRCHI